ncbi:MAG: LacI family DNA-binding transcriptional regulator [Planctomycetes bacterium]|nr:LacI family DNA-binding transcriptional regulator [Planctomycetota bacterium]
MAKTANVNLLYLCSAVLVLEVTAMIKISDIAETLQLSRVTVSAILNDRYRKLGISEKTAQRVLQRAEAMGYVPNQNALSMKTGRSMTIGMLSSSLSEEWGAKILVGALNAIQSTPYSLRIEAVHGSEEERGALERLLGSRVEGLFCCNINPAPETNEFFELATKRYGVAVASTNCSFTFNHDRFESDNSAAVMALIKHLFELGHRKIAHIGGDRISESSRERSEAFLRGVAALNLNVAECPVLWSNWKMDEARSLARQLMEPHNRPTAVVCANDRIAACTLQVANELNLKVPEELSVVGMTNERISQLTIPAITTVSIPEEDIGRASIMALIESIESKEKVASQKITRHECSIVMRNSTAVVPER